MPISSCEVFCPRCGTIKKGTDKAVKLWARLHAKQTHGTKTYKAVDGFQEPQPEYSSRRNMSKDDDARYAKAKEQLYNTLNIKN